MPFRIRVGSPAERIFVDVNAARMSSVPASRPVQKMALAVLAKKNGLAGGDWGPAGVVIRISKAADDGGKINFRRTCAGAGRRLRARDETAGQFATLNCSCTLLRNA